MRQSYELQHRDEFPADTSVRHRLYGGLRPRGGLLGGVRLPLRRGATAEDIRPRWRQESYARALAGPVAEPPGGSQGTRAPLPRTVFHPLAGEKRDRAQRETRPALGRQERVQLLRRLRRKGLLQPHHRREHQPSVAGGQRGVQFRPLSLRGADIRPSDDYPREQRDGTDISNRLPPAQREPLGRQPKRLHHRGLHGIGEQGHPDD